MRNIGIVAALVCCFGSSIVACSDDSGGNKGDGGAGKKDSGLDPIPRLDGAVGDDVVPVCDRFDPSACGNGQICDELIRSLPDGTTVLYSGCVDARQLRAPGDPCTPWLERYETDGLSDVVFLDPCGDGSICEPDPEVRGASSCQLTCQSGAFGDGRVGCSSSSAYCFGQGQYEEVCIESDACDPAAQTGCAKGKACYLQINDSGDGVLSVCLTPGSPTIADQAACQYVNDCAAGSSCLGPAGLPLTQWTANDFVCRPTCNGPNDGEDAGVDDAGAACSCEAYSATMLDFSEIPKKPYGQCEL